MDCPECGKMMTLIEDDNLGQVWFCTICGKEVTEKF
jgi:hypothetical protein